MAFTKITGPGIHTLTNIVSHNVKSSGIITAVNENLSGWLAVGSTASFSGNVSIGGTLTYDDVTNVESVGLITAKAGIFIPDDQKLEIGNVAGSGDLSIFYDSSPGESLITHTGPGVFKIEGNSSNNIFIRPKSGENSITAKPDQDVELYFNNELRFSTSGVGATIRDSAASGSGISNSLDLLNNGNNSGDGSSISFLRSPGNTRAQIIAIKNETSNNETDLVFKTTKNGGTLTESLRILGNTQRVGIGTTIPNAPIHVQSSDNTLGILTSTDDGANLDLSDNDTMSRIRSVDGRLHLYADFGSNVSDSAIRFFVDGANEKVRFTSTGRVGIGTTNPTRNLQIGGLSVDSYNAIRFGRRIASSNTNLPVIGHHSGDGTGSGLALCATSTNGAIHFFTGNGGNGFGANDNQERVVIKHDGKVGIGTTTPQERLHIHEGDIVIGQDAGNSTDIRNYIKFGRVDAPKAAIGFINTTGNGRGDILFMNSDVSNTSEFTNTDEVVRITHEGLVGIGLNNPSYKLHVYGGNVRFAQPAGTDATFDINEATTTNPLRLMQTATEARIQNIASLPFNIRSQAGTGSTAHLAFWTRDDERLRITSTGRVVIGSDSARTVGGSVSRLFQVEGTDGGSGISITRNSNNASTPTLDFGKSRGNSVGSNVIVQEDDQLGVIQFCGSDGTDTQTEAAQIAGLVDGTPGSNDMPGRLVFKTTPDGSPTSLERFRITSTGLIRMGNGAEANTEAHVTAAIFQNTTGAATILKLGNTNTPSSANNRAIEFCDGAGGTEGSSKYTYARIKAERTGGSNAGRLIFSTKPDNSNGPSEALRILSDGKVLIGHDTNIFNYKLAVFGTDGGHSGISASRFSNDTSPSSLILSKSRGTTIGSYTIVQDDDEVGMIDFRGSDGTDNISKVAEIKASIDGTPGSNDMPGRLQFHVTADGASSTTERLRIAADGRSTFYGTNELDLIHLSTGNSAGNTFANVRGDNEAGIRIRGGGSYDGGTIELGGGLRDTDPGIIKFETGTGSTPTERLRIDAGGRILIGRDANNTGTGTNPIVQIQSTSANNYGRIELAYAGGNTLGPAVYFVKARGSTADSVTAAGSADQCGAFFFLAADGTDRGNRVASIQAHTDGTIASNQTPGKLVFRTTPSNSNATLERLSITSAGIVQLNTANNTYIRGGIYAKYTGASGNTANINTSSIGKVSWLQTNTEIFENGGFTNTATDVTVPKTGIYMIIFNGYLNGTGGAARTNVRFRFKVNGTDQTDDLSLNNYIRHDSSHDESSVNFTVYLSLNSGDAVAVSAQQIAAAGDVVLVKNLSSLTFHLVA